MSTDNDVDYHIDEDLEKLFHSDLQNLQLGHDKDNHDDVVGDHLPEWLVGVIVVIIMLIIAFFVMIITSIIKNRQKNRSSTYISTPAVCDDLESGKIGNGGDISMKMTSFSSVSEGMNGQLQIADGSAVGETMVNDDKETLANGLPRVDSSEGVQGCRNPLFVDDEQVAAEKVVSEDVSRGGNKTGDCGEGTSDAVKPIVGEGEGKNSRSKGKGNVGKHKHSPQKSKMAPGTPHSPEEATNVKPQDTPLPACKLKGGAQRASKRGKVPSAGAAESSDYCSLEPIHDCGVPPIKRGSGGSGKLELESCCEDSGIELCTSESPVRCGPQSRSQSVSTEEEDSQSSPTLKSTFHLTEVVVHDIHAGSLQNEAKIPAVIVEEKMAEISERLPSCDQWLQQCEATSSYKEQTSAEIHHEDIESKPDVQTKTQTGATDESTMEEVSLTEEDSHFAMSTNL